MNLAILYHPDNEYARPTEELVEELKSHTDRKIEFIDVDSREGVEQASNYGAVDYPAFVVLTEDGQVYNMWQGPMLPSIEEITSYLNI
jgi:hypothetical protein